ncbi:MarR family winged helix-turn-helix transcriptional regulator [Jongsikchunia kroppenstedtii]|uniref:MarR family winged helix-turn-helix transcriptional regulator n=1 Tax=Jongsikchunia kroppenstedtii TaxID=1121721 RepID=UPI00037A988D|nr:MarR family transcriptional regulator [Jongsikchunia kroppenstedtii]
MESRGPRDSVDRDLPTWTWPMVDVDPEVEAARQRIGRLARTFTRALGEVAKQEGLSTADWETLSAIVRAEGRCTPTVLMRTLQLTSGTVSTRLNRLLDAGLATVLADADDGRSRPIAVTDEGFARWQQATAARTRSEREIFAVLSAEQVGTLNDLLSLVLARCEADLGEAGRHDLIGGQAPR